MLPGRGLRQPPRRRAGDRSLPRHVDNSHARSLFPSPLSPCSLCSLVPPFPLSYPLALGFSCVFYFLLISLCFSSRFEVINPVSSPSRFVSLFPYAVHALLSPCLFVLFLSLSLFLSVSPVSFLFPFFFYFHLSIFSCILFLLCLSLLSLSVSLFCTLCSPFVSIFLFPFPSLLVLICLSIFPSPSSSFFFFHSFVSLSFPLPFLSYVSSCPLIPSFFLYLFPFSPSLSYISPSLLLLCLPLFSRPPSLIKNSVLRGSLENVPGLSISKLPFLVSLFVFLSG